MAQHRSTHSFQPGMIVRLSPLGRALRVKGDRGIVRRIGPTGKRIHVEIVETGSTRSFLAACWEPVEDQGLFSPAWLEGRAMAAAFARE